MKSSQGLLKVLILTLTVSVSIQSYGGQTVEITRDNFKDALFKANTDVIYGMSTILRAKDQLSVTRSNLIPSLNLTIGTSINPALFLVNSASCLVPFLFPSKWFDLKASKKSFHSQIIGLDLTKLNTLATGFALANRITADQNTLALQEAQIDRLKPWVQKLAEQASLGITPDAEAKSAQLDLGKQEVEVSKLRELVAEDIATMRKILSLPLDADIKINVSHFDQTEFEKMSIQAAHKIALDQAPERTQLELLRDSAKASVKSTEWSFLAGCSGSQGNIGTGKAFSTTTGFSLQIGYGIFPSVKLAKRNVYEVELRELELDLELGRILESAIIAINESQERLKIANDNQKIAKKLFDQAASDFQFGRGSTKQVIDAQATLSGAEILVLESEQSVDAQRITLQRMGLEGSFKDIVGTSAAQYPKRKKFLGIF